LMKGSLPLRAVSRSRDSVRMDQDKPIGDECQQVLLSPKALPRDAGLSAFSSADYGSRLTSILVSDRSETSDERRAPKVIVTGQGCLRCADARAELPVRGSVDRSKFARYLLDDVLH
jgi:hypothetical protein